MPPARRAKVSFVPRGRELAERFPPLAPQLLNCGDQVRSMLVGGRDEKGDHGLLVSGVCHTRT